MCANDACLNLALESAVSAQGGSASVVPLRGEQVIGRSHRIRGVNRGPDSELVVLFLLRISGCGCSSQDVPAERHTILCSNQKQTPLESVETEKTHDSRDLQL